jgi:hypothetical protein
MQGRPCSARVPAAAIVFVKVQDERIDARAQKDLPAGFLHGGQAQVRDNQVVVDAQLARVVRLQKKRVHLADLNGEEAGELHAEEVVEASVPYEGYSCYEGRLVKPRDMQGPSVTSTFSGMAKSHATWPRLGG